MQKPIFIRSTEQSSVCRKLRQPGCVSLVATVNLDLESSDLVETVDQSCSKYDTDRDTRVEGKPNGNKNTVNANDLKTRKRALVILTDTRQSWLP